MNEQVSDKSGAWSRGWRVAGWGAAAALLALPAIAMQFTDEVAWGIEDFTIFGIMLLIAGLLIELAVRATRSAEARAIAIALVIAGFLLVWAELAVGIFH